ncbi:hypothetical protein EMIHUDRAFT_222780 [Emiliania huxleyi CCMP1516]|uniref:Uncharacterized protein n=2 Tax=Emiliania huxleyi TaxID=2903 RepID=A0A0D3KX55_EMIH1|nr:hypothetical protein EMIHUDRAFT_222780 [Emiliania huxleyi CCMP1516]EOD40340.1 hypothetical protein EMIHUDRAFT_222780 [Emiliania huxleyi CCMP1516]|eukprot:XP_005792769.1 hypothetical protein EMIHUDRAFT_222780 [Emiliania huxleyi CCMP1516]
MFSNWGMQTGTPAGEHIYAFTVAAAGTIVFDTCGSGLDTVVSVFTSGLAKKVAQGDDSIACGKQAILTASLDAGAYDLVVEGYYKSEGTYTLTETTECYTDIASKNHVRRCVVAPWLGISYDTHFDTPEDVETCLVQPSSPPPALPPALPPRPPLDPLDSFAAAVKKALGADSLPANDIRLVLAPIVVGPFACCLLGLASLGCLYLCMPHGVKRSPPRSLLSDDGAKAAADFAMDFGPAASAHSGGGGRGAASRRSTRQSSSIALRSPAGRLSNSKPRRYNGYECLCVAVLQCAVREQASVEAEMLRTTNP